MKNPCGICGLTDAESIGVTNYVTVNHKTGEYNDHGGIITTVEFDICGICFDNKVSPWLVENGATPRVRKFDF